MMLRKHTIGALLLLILASAAHAVEPANRRTTGLIAADTRWVTPYHMIDSGGPGPVVMVVGGVHGNEPAGAAAAAQISHWSITRGRLIVVPAANQPALQLNQRRMPDMPADAADLNRNFPRAAHADESPRGELAEALYQLAAQHRPDWLIDLHEGYDFTQINPKSVGSSIIRARTGGAQRIAPMMLETVNATIDDPKRKLVLKGPPVDGSLARAATEHLSAEAMILETTSKDQPLSQRARQHRIMVHVLLSDLSMIGGDANVMVDRDAAVLYAVDGAPPTLVAIYDGGGTMRGPGEIDANLAAMDRVVARRVGPPDIKSGVLEQFDVVIFPGGSASKQAGAIGEDGREHVRRFVRAGGGYIGHCAGAYLATSGYTWGLKIIDAHTVDRQHWRRGVGTIQIELTDRGRRLLADQSGLVDIHYANGPLLAASGLDELPDFDALAYYRSEIARNGAPTGVMIDTPAIITAPYGAGRVLCFSPHPEYTDGLESYVHRAVQWVAEREALETTNSIGRAGN